MNACEYCGACCVSLRVSFPAEELDDRAGGHVPVGLSEVYGNVYCMRTTADGRCIALRGVVGVKVHCLIYELRPGSCREFAPLAALGHGDEACDEVRCRQGLPPLSV